MASPGPTPAKSKDPKAYIIRRARLTEGFRLGEIAARTYRDAPLTKFLSPRLLEHYGDYERGFQHRAQARMLSPANLTFVACEAATPGLAVGYAQFARLGDDEGARQQVASRSSIGLAVLAWLFWAWTALLALVAPDHSADPAALAAFMAKVGREEKLHWEGHPERKNRWAAQSVVVLEEYQGRGLGKRLMQEVIALAEEENVVVSLEASAPGRLMYQSVGFELLAPFQDPIEGDEGGGVMMYTPKSWKVDQKI